MPVYEYQCSACLVEFEREQRISDEPVKKCPNCGKLKVKRLISRTSFGLKGGGWYGDLYASQKPAADKKDDAPAAAGADAAVAPAPTADSSKGDGAAASADSGSDGAKSASKGDKKKPGKKKAAAA